MSMYENQLVEVIYVNEDNYALIRYAGESETHFVDSTQLLSL